MGQNVFISSLVFFIPLKRIRRKYRSLRQAEGVKTLFAHFPNAQCYYKALEEMGASPTIRPHTFYYESRYNSNDKRWRQVMVKPFLLEFKSGKRGPLKVLALLISVDKVFDKEKATFKQDDFCTEFDLVNLKKAFFDGLLSTKDTNAISNLDWIKELLYEIEGVRHRHVTIPFSTIDVNAQKVVLTNGTIDLRSLNEVFKQNYYSIQSNKSIDDFLSTPIQMQRFATQPDLPDGVPVDERCFVYGLLYANDNFMMLHKPSMETVINKFYTNNMAEKFWADDGSIVHVITHTPFFLPSEEKVQVLKGDLNDVLCLPEMCMLMYLKLLLSAKHKKPYPNPLKHMSWV